MKKLMMGMLILSAGYLYAGESVITVNPDGTATKQEVVTIDEFKEQLNALMAEELYYTEQRDELQAHSDEKTALIQKNKDKQVELQGVIDQINSSHQ